MPILQPWKFFLKYETAEKNIHFLANCKKFWKGWKVKKNNNNNLTIQK